MPTLNYIGTGLGLVTRGLENGMDIPSLANVLDTDTLGGQPGTFDPGGSPPVAKVITAEDNEDGTGTVITRDEEVGGVTDVIWAAISGGVFVSFGSVWVGNTLTLDITSLGIYFVYCRSSGGTGVTDSLIIRAPVTNAEGDDTGNIPFVRRAMRQDAVYWPPETTYDRFGNPDPREPVQIACRWEENNVEFVDLSGTTQMSKAQVYVDREVLMGGILMLGTMDDVVDYVNPIENNKAEEILMFKQMPNLRKTGFLRLAFL